MNEQVMLTSAADPLEALARLHEQNRREIEARWQRSQVRLIVMFLLALLVGGIFHMLSLSPGAPPVVIRNLHSMSSTDLCPGDRLTYNYDLIGDEAVVINVTTTIWRVTPPQTVVYSGSKTDILLPPIRHVTGESFIIPATVFDPTVPELVPTKPGLYERRVAVTAVGRDTVAEVAGLPFAVREDCE